MKLLLAPLFSLLCIVLVTGCDQQGRPTEQVGLDRLEKGVSTESDVRLVMGQPEKVWQQGNGDRVLEYPKGPAGPRTWMFDIAENGVLKNYRQVLTEDTFSTIQPGMSQEMVRRTLGKPRSMVNFPLSNEEVWDWLYLEHGQNPNLFNVHFDQNTRQVKRMSHSDYQKE